MTGTRTTACVPCLHGPAQHGSSGWTVSTEHMGRDGVRELCRENFVNMLVVAFCRLLI